MMKLLLGRLLPAGIAAGILTSALSPLRPALDAFGAAAIALTGQDPPPVAGGADFGSDLIPAGLSGKADLRAAAKPQKAPTPKRKLQELANRLRDPNAPKLKQFQAPGGPSASKRSPRRWHIARPAMLLRRRPAPFPASDPSQGSGACVQALQARPPAQAGLLGGSVGACALSPQPQPGRVKGRVDQRPTG